MRPKTRDPSAAVLRSYQPSRPDWVAVYTTAISDRGLRAVGSLYNGPIVTRRAFDVKIDDCGNFSVGAGDGTGTVVRFRHPMFSPTPDE